MSLFSVENGHDDDTPIFDSELLGKIDWESCKDKFKHGVSPTNPGENLTMRPLRATDYDRGYMKLLSQLTKVGEPSVSQFVECFSRMKACKGTYYVVVVEDTNVGQIIGTSTLVVEQKFIHNCALKGYIEDVVVSEDYRGKQLGKLLVETLRLLAQHLGVYKLVLNCKDRMIEFYESCGYCCEKGNSNLMVLRFRD